MNPRESFPRIWPRAAESLPAVGRCAITRPDGPKKRPPASSSPSEKTVVDVVHEFSMPSMLRASRASRGRVNSRVTPACRQHESPRHRAQTCHGCNVRKAGAIRRLRRFLRFKQRSVFVLYFCTSQIFLNRRNLRITPPRGHLHPAPLPGTNPQGTSFLRTLPRSPQLFKAQDVDGGSAAFHCRGF